MTLPLRIVASLPLWYVSDVKSTTPTNTSDQIVGVDSFTFRSEVKGTHSRITRRQ